MELRVLLLVLVSYGIHALSEHHPGYRLELKQVDSYASGTLTRAKRLEKALKTSKSRANFFSDRRKTSNSPTKSNNTRDRHSPELSSSIYQAGGGEGEYMMELSIGTPPQLIPAMIDTGSDLVWLKCDNCDHCDLDHHGETIFFSDASSSYKKLPCNSTHCSGMSSAGIGPRCEETCKYKYEYGDGSRTSGDVGSDRISFRSHGAGEDHRSFFDGFLFGCARKLKGDWNFTQGLIGLGQKSHSLIQQLGDKLGYKFSYCLVSYDSPPSAKSFLFLGSSAALRGHDVVSTPILHGDHLDQTLYYVDLQSITIGGVPVVVYDKESGHNTSVGPFLANKTVIDSGTTYTLLTPPVYEAMRKSIEEQVILPTLGNSAGLDLCFNSSGDTSYGFPSVTFYFANQVQLVLPFENIFQVTSRDVVCLSMDSSGGDLSIIGNMQQQNFHILYDLVASQISFQRVECENL
ncbi:aspartic proteinase nepenthesin-1 [Selaginella moellendorffii]|nr:aspartic proteinase nepenthesin-1 [Selaginella moellendorffii]|eukprot:XP_002974198.2 aspartic proteinase nepenthesin-1 [Selaginella moellendorffii]